MDCKIVLIDGPYRGRHLTVDRSQKTLRLVRPASSERSTGGKISTIDATSSAVELQYYEVARTRGGDLKLYSVNRVDNGVNVYDWLVRALANALEEVRDLEIWGKRDH